MSLFPAYSGDASASTSTGVNIGQQTTDNVAKVTSSDDSWLQNSSFKTQIETSLEPSETLQESITIADETPVDPDSKKHHKKKSSKHSKKSKHKSKESKEDSKRSKTTKKPEIIFTGNEDYYVDKKAESGYNQVNTLYKPAIPRFLIGCRTLGRLPRYFTNRHNKRYWQSKSLSITTAPDENVALKCDRDGEDFLEKNKLMNNRLAMYPSDIDAWIEFVNHQKVASKGVTKTQLAERVMGILDKALSKNPGCDRLYQAYVEIIDSTFPSFEVSKIVDGMLMKDSTNFTLWCAQIMATQGSMARCYVPEVLALYQKCMQHMHTKRKQQLDSDSVMIKLFIRCSLFLRESGLYEQFFALIRLALELNTPLFGNNIKFDTIRPLAADQQLLIEYEEMVLSSGLPLHEIWSRVETLRQSFNFLPWPTDESSCSDPQRIVFNEDVCYFIYPLENSQLNFKLTLYILYLLRIPFGLGDWCEDFPPNELHSIEILLNLLLDYESDVDSIIFEVVRDLTATGPSILPTQLGGDVFRKTQIEMLKIVASAFQGDEQKRQISILLWLKLERINLRLHKLAKKTDVQNQAKALRSSVKQLLKSEINRNVLNFYCEYALIEAELDVSGTCGTSVKIFEAAIGQSQGNENVLKSELANTFVCYAEFLIFQLNNTQEACRILTCYALNVQLQEKETLQMNDTRKMLTLKKFNELTTNVLQIEENIEIIELEQYFLPDYFICLCTAQSYYTLIVQNKTEAVTFIEMTLKHFRKTPRRHRFLREKLYELFAKIIALPHGGRISSGIIIKWMTNGLGEFPQNIKLMKLAATQFGHTWIEVRATLFKSSHPVAVIFMVIAATYRFYKCKQSMEQEDLQTSAIDQSEATFKMRILNILKSSLQNDNAMAANRKCSFLWRLYLRGLVSIESGKVTHENVKNCILSALDECPWHKALYMDAVVCCPQEAGPLQDLLIEKQLRICALPQELEILRK